MLFPFLLIIVFNPNKDVMEVSQEIKKSQQE